MLNILLYARGVSVLALFAGNGTGYAVYPEISACAAKIKAAGGATPLVGRYTTTAPQKNGADAKAWRCYSPSALDATTGEYNGSAHFCGDPALIG